MQIKIDSEKKEITVLETVKAVELIRELHRLISEFDGNEWSITGAYDNYFHPYYTQPEPVFPDFYPQITCDTTEQKPE